MLTHVREATSSRLWASCMAAREVLVVAGADGRESCGNGLTASIPVYSKIHGRFKKWQQPNNRQPLHSTEEIR